MAQYLFIFINKNTCLFSHYKTCFLYYWFRFLSNFVCFCNS
uniref:Uncharacterized protein n=1 Tax=Anguilla anguilla TaxID=7936 RepID=A0A0E9R2E6_ANGAN